MPRSLDSFLDFWPPEPDPSRRGPAARAAAGPATTPAMRRAEETTRVAREATDAATEKRAAQVAKLKAARLERDATEAAVAEPPKKARKKG
jgi:hypothetical protein